MGAVENASSQQPAAEGYSPTDDEVKAWNERNDEAFQGRLDAARCAIDDARSLHMLSAAPAAPSSHSSVNEMELVRALEAIARLDIGLCTSGVRRCLQAGIISGTPLRFE